ncbi:hypothetical protein CHUAL_005656 [Chamberlinius hualienensis]
MADSLTAYCGSPFWDYDIVWNTTTPDFTDCFQKTVLVWIPCAFLWLLSPLEIHLLLKSRNRHIPWTWLNIAKLAISVSLCLLTIVDMGHSVHRYNQGEDLPYASYYTPFTLFSTFLLVTVFTILEKRRGIQSSGLMFNFWLLLVICGLVTYRTLLMRAIDPVAEVNTFSFVLFMIYYPLIVSMLVLSCMADSSPIFREQQDIVTKPCPEEHSSFLSRVLFSWFDSLAWYGYRHSLERKDLWSLKTEDRSSYLVPQFERKWNAEIQKSTRNRPVQTKASFSSRRQEVEITPVDSNIRQPSLVKALFKTFGGTFMYGAFLKLVSDLLIFASPLLLRWLINFVSSNEPMWRGYLYAVLMFIAAIAQSLVLNQYFYKMFILGLHVRTSIIAAIYKKSLVLSNTARKASTVGEIVNLMSVDAQRIMDLLPYINMIWSAPLQIGIALYMLWNTLGPSVLTGLGFMILLVPLNGVLANFLKKLQLKMMKCKDDRVKLMNEVLNGMKVLKLYAWETSFENQVQSIRGKELTVLKTAAYLGAATSFIWMCAPFVVSLASFATFVLVDPANILDASKAFVSLSVFNIIRMPMSFIPMLIVFLVQSSVSIKRMNTYLCHEELKESDITHDQFETYPISMEQASFSWGKDEKEILKNITLQTPEGSLVAVVGPVGSGKSSLISALLGEMDRIEGRINIKGSVAYAAQQAWIQNATVKENILFGKEVDDHLYDQCIHACALKSDLDMLPAGDNTEIGEKGINLSGGQKQRVSLARAVYSDKDVYLLDDPLSAVDAHVGKHIFENVIGPHGVLKRKTRILVTHGITYLPQVDVIIVLNDGSISEVGSYKELLAKKGAFAEFLMTYLGDEKHEVDVEGLEELKEELLATIGSPELERHLSRQFSRSKSHASDDGSAKLSFQKSRDSNRRSVELSPIKKVEVNGDAKQENAKLIQKETVETGEVKMSIYWYYIKSVGLTMVSITMMFNLLSHGCSIGSNLWLSAWSNDKPNVNGTQDVGLRDLRLGIYGGLGFGQAIFVMIGSMTMAFGAIRASRILHNDMLGNIMRSPMSFFDTTPLGRIVNRFAKDVDVVDNSIPMTIRSWVMCVLQVISTLVVICISTPIFIAVIVPLSILYYFIQKLYVATSRQLKRLESASRSPIYSHFSETITGASTIRAYNKQHDFIVLSENRVDENQISYFPSVIANRWLAVRLEFVGNIVVLAASLFAVAGKDSMSAGIVGLSVSYALSVTATLNWMVRMSGELETNIVAVERMKEYAITPTEASWNIESNQPPPQWPQEGVVQFKKYTTRYREGLDLVLRGISCQINSGEKVGIVGRTGAGKSSLTLAIFRIIESAGGSIVIDGIDISEIGLHDLRSKLTIIPQDPVLFSGTLRINLDPFNSHSDEELWKALELSHLRTFVSQLPTGLQHTISEGGENLSVGQRQLVCLARALLRKSKILVLDEATAAVDLETDGLIQATIRKEFGDCTVLTIAHRLNTIMDSNKVIVLDHGIIKEFDSPENLLQQKDSIFYGMAKDAGIVNNSN